VGSLRRLRLNYAQYIYIAPEKDLVIVRLGKEEGE